VPPHASVPRLAALPPAQVTLRDVEVAVPDARSAFETVPGYLLGLVTSPLARAAGRPRPTISALSGVNATFKAGYVLVTLRKPSTPTLMTGRQYGSRGSAL
jgi:hypothetical protein